MSEFTLPVRVYYEDTDAGGVVYYANYLRFMERGRTEFMRALGYDLRVLARDPGILFVVANVDIDYRRPAHHDDQLVVSVVVAERGRAGLTFAQQVRRGAELLAEAKVRVACVDAQSFRPRALPDELALRLTVQLERGVNS